MSIPRLTFSKNWENPADYATHQTSEEQNRKDIQSLFTELLTYNNYVLLPALETLLSSGSGGAAGETAGDFLPLSGGTLRGPLRLVRDPEMTGEAATKAYVDERAGQVRTDLEGGLSAVTQRADAIELLVQDAVGTVTSLSLKPEEILALVRDALGTASFLEVLADHISFGVTRYISEGDQTAAQLTLKIGENERYGLALLNGSLDLSGQLSAEALYAAYGEISDLEVDRLSTSRRIAKYLRGDTGDDNYIRVRRQELEFVTASCTGQTEQARNPETLLLYWPTDVTGLSLDAEGYPQNAAGERIFTTTRVTEYPVMVYGYTEAVKRSIRFEQGENGVYQPIDTFGAGNAAGNNIAHIVKGTESFDLLYHTAAGKELGIRMRNEGYVDISGLRRTDYLDFSHWDAGYFVERVEGAALDRTFAVEFDEQGRPVKITDSGGHATSIRW